MRIVVVSHMYPSSFNNVAGIFVHKQVKALINQGFEVKVVSPVPLVPFPLGMVKSKWKSYADIPEKDFIDGVEVYYPRYVEFPGSRFFEYSGYFMYLGIKNIIEKLYTSWKFDVIHSHVAIPDGLSAMLVNKKINVPHVVTIHGQDLQFTIFKNVKCKDYLFKVLDSADRIITVSTKLKNIIKSEKFGDRVVVINNGIDPEDCKCTGDSLKETGRKIILSVSNLIESKGIDLNIKAISILKDKYPDIKYCIIGVGPEKEHLEKLVNSLDLSNHISFLGRLPYNEVMRYMSAADIFALPSWQEGFGVVYIEAMAHGKPVIAVKGEGIEDVIVDGKNGFLVTPHNVEDIVKTIDYLLSHTKEAKLIGFEGQKNVLSNFTWEKSAYKTMEVYRQIVK